MTAEPPPLTMPTSQRAEPAPGRAGTGGAAGDNGLWIVLGLLAAYSAVHIGFRLIASSALGEDDPLENILAQDLRAIYDLRQPPLYDWVLYAIQAVTGPTISSFLAIKYAALIGTGAALYAIARRSIGSGVAALLAVEALALIYQLSWRFHEGYTHQVGAMVAVAATMWALLRAADAPNTASFALLGAVTALGALTQPVFLVFAVALWLAAAAEPELRRSFTASRVAIAVLPGVVSIGFLILVSIRSEAGSPYIPTHDAYSLAWPGWARVWGGFLNALRAPLFYLSPLILIVPLFFRGFLGRAWKDVVQVTSSSREPMARDPGEPGVYERIVLRTSIIGFGLSLAGAAALGLKGYASHVFMPLYLTSVVWIMGAVQRTQPANIALARFSRLALAIAVVALVARLANMFVLDPVCKICRWGVPYEGLAAELSRAGGGAGLVITPDHELGGNLRAVMPDATIALSGSRHLQSGKMPTGGKPILAVWRAAMPDTAAELALAAYLKPGQSVRAATLVRVPWRHLWRPDGYRFSEWKYVLIEGASAPVNRVP